MIRFFFVAFFSPLLAVAATSWTNLEPFHQWPMDKAVKILNDSPWAKQETFTRVIRGVGSGISGEKEIYNTFYVRFLSARPIREAYARVQQIQYESPEVFEYKASSVFSIMDCSILLKS